MTYQRTSLRALLTSLGLATGLAQEGCNNFEIPPCNAGGCEDASAQDSSYPKPKDAAVADTAWVPQDAAEPDAADAADGAVVDGSDQ